MEKLSLAQIGESVLHDSDYHGFHSFFNEVWASKHNFIVIFARRCYALNNVFLRILFDEKERKKKAERIITQNALMLYADEFANVYKKTGTFPSILLVDDIMLHGRGVATLLYNFEELIWDSLTKYSDPSRQQSVSSAQSVFAENDRYYVHQKLIAAVNISIYAMNKAPTLMDESFIRCIKYVKQQRSTDLKDLSLRISTFLQSANEPNTSYRYSFPIPTTKLLTPAKNWLKIPWKYRGKLYDIYYKRKEGSENFYPIVYSHGEEYIKIENDCETTREAYTWVTGVAVGGDIHFEQFNNICNEIISILKDEGDKDKKNPTKFNFLIKILNSKHPLQQRQRTQLISFFLSSFYVYDFCKEFEINVDTTYKRISKESSDVEKNILFDVHKIVGNFGKPKDVNDAIWALFDENSKLMQRLQKPLETFSILPSQISWSGYSENTDYTKHDNNICVQYNRLVEDILYVLGTNSEYEAFEIRSNRKRFIPSSHKDSPDTLSLCQCLSEVGRKNNQSTSPIPLDAHSILACLTVLVDCGLAAMNFGYDPTSGYIQCMFKAGELSTFTIPRRYHWFIPALSLIEKEYHTNEDRYAVLNEFITQLDSTEQIKDPNEHDSLTHLIKQGTGFIERLYRCGQTINDWNINLLTIDDWVDTNPAQDCSYLNFLLHNKTRRSIYLKKAKVFLQKKWVSRFT